MLIFWSTSDNPSEFLKSVSGSFKRIYIEVPDFESTPLNLVRVDVGSKLIYTDEDHVTEFDRVELERIIAMSGLTISDPTTVPGY